MNVKRRELMLAGLGGLAGWIAHRLRGGISHASTESSPELNWKQPREIGLAQTAELAYNGYKDKGLGCCHGVFKGLVLPQIEKMGPPYNLFPIEIMRAGKSDFAGMSRFHRHLDHGHRFY